MSHKIEDYALIGDCHGAGLVSRAGSIDWLCIPRFDSPACFAALLGTPENGRWSLSPRGEIKRCTRRYRGASLVLETEMETAEGTVAIIDLMPPHTEAVDVVRIVEGRSGRVAMQMDLAIRFDYGSIVPWVTRQNSELKAIAGPDMLHLHAPVEMHGKNMHTVAEFEVSAGERLPFVMTFHPSHLPQPDPADPEEALTKTEKFWCDWAAQSNYTGRWSEAVERSLVTLKALTYAPTGGVVAAPTTSLPEHIGGVRNWDYRYCWLRDATIMLNSLLSAGYREEARAWREWLLRAVAGSPSQLQIMYGISGERRLAESTLDWLCGYENSQPVRIGNGAFDQRQLDVYGELMDAMHLCRHFGIENKDGWQLERALLNHLESDWEHPDEGIWEVRGPQQHFTHSKVMAWVAFDRGVQAIERFGHEGPLERWKAARDAVCRQVCEQGFNSELNSFTQYYGSKTLDASLLMIPLVGFLPAKDPRMVGTMKAVERELMEDGFVARYQTGSGVDGLPGHEGTFLACSFWYVENLALAGRHEEACDMFERLLAVRNDVGLLAEEYDARDKRQLGNFPQAFSHLALVDSALTLTDPPHSAADRRSRHAQSAPIKPST